jgi:hypothetical protein
MTITLADRASDLSQAIAEHAVAYSEDSLDESSGTHLRSNLLDVIAVTIGGLNEEGLEAVRSFLRTTSAADLAVEAVDVRQVGLEHHRMVGVEPAHQTQTQLGIRGRIRVRAMSPTPRGRVRRR